MIVNLNAGNTQEKQSSIDNFYVGTNTNDIKVSTTYSITNGLSNISEIDGFSQLNTIFGWKPELTTPSQDALDTPVKLDPEVQKILGMKIDSVPCSKFTIACLNKWNYIQNGGENSSSTEASKEDESDFELESDFKLDLKKVSNDDITMFCLLLSQETRSKTIKGLKSFIEVAKKEAQSLMKQHLETQQKMAAENAKATKELARAKKRNIARAVLGAVFAVAMAVVAVVATVATAGAGAVLLGFAIAGAVCAVASAAVSVASAGLTIAALTTDDPQKAKALNEANKILGYVSIALSVATIICSLPSFTCSIVRAVMHLKHVVNAVQAATKTAAAVIGATQAGTTGGLLIAEGSSNKKLAKYQRDIKTMEIKMEELEEQKKFAKDFMDDVDQKANDLINILLRIFGEVGSELVRIFNNENAMADKININKQA